MLVPLFFASWFVDYLIALGFLRELERGAVKRTVMVANAVS